MGAGSLSGEQRRRVVLLGLPTFGLTLAITVVSTYLPTVAREVTTSTIVIGAVVGGEGIMALWVPLIVGPWSDQLTTRIGGRLPFLVAATPLAAVALVVMAAVDSILAIALAAAVFFFAYFIAYEPYRAMYPDLIDDEAAGRAQATQAIWRGAATSVALVSGGVLLSLAQPVPFALAAVVLLASVVAFTRLVMRAGLARQDGGHDAESARETASRLHRLVGEVPQLRAYLVANALWELALAALKAFVILYMTVGLGYSLVTASLIVGGVGVVVLVGAIVAGRVGDDAGRLRVMRWTLWVYGAGLLVPGLITWTPLVAVAVPFVAFGGGAVMALAYAILIPRMPEEERGALTGFYSLSRGVGITLGPILAGALIAATAGNIFEGTEGFQATWIVCAAAILLSIPFLRGVDDADG